MKFTEGSTTVHPHTAPDVTLPARLKALREETWPERVVTQSQLAGAFSAERSTSVPLISSWESSTNPKTPPVARLEAYARFFATERSMGNGHPQLLRTEELTGAELTRYEDLLAELSRLRALAVGQPGATPHPSGASDSLWHFGANQDVLIVCAPLPDKYASRLGSFTDIRDADYIDLYTYADPDALIELFGHLRMMNPQSWVTFTTSDKLTEDDYTKHLILLGGVDWNTLTQDVLRHVTPPVRQITRVDTDDPGGFEVTDGPDRQSFRPVLRGNTLVEDVAHFYRLPNPYNDERTLTICNGMFGRGTYGVVRALTDARFRDRNDEYVRANFDEEGVFSLVTRVRVIRGHTLTPDWTKPEMRLHQRPEGAH
ncbi:XRE family transcriptional regulator [Kutzneria sp. NPDC052558]|uniref:XRE family transcriptional regulator n=1 Tax=Kutzneria sp. NPDC052558 TaxID=3364121 RepID=UPI0037CA0F13